MKLVVTTTSHAGPAQRTRARLVADRCGVPVLRRDGSLAGVFAEADLAYVVGRHRDELRSDRERIAVHAGLTRTRALAGTDHPLVRALGDRGPVVDATLGLAGDALHVAALGIDVLGIEASPVVYSLLEEGLARLARGTGPVSFAASRVRPVQGWAHEVLAGLPVDRYAVVFFAPMFEAPRRAAPGYALFRAVARHEPLDRATVNVALHVAPRVVVKVPAGSPAPKALSGLPVHREPGKAIDFFVSQRAR